MSKNRVVITGLGAITPLGNSVEAYWDGLENGRSGIDKITHFDASGYPCQIGGEVKGFQPTDYISRKEARRIPRVAQLALGAATQAVKDAGLPAHMPNPERASIVFGTAIGGIDRFIEGIKDFEASGRQVNRVNPFILPSGLPNMASFLLAKQFQCLGPNKTITTACATSTQTIGEGGELIRRGLADVVIAGGSEALIRYYAFAGFCAMRAMPTNYNEDPARASRPFDANREGFIFSEGAGALVLESLAHAQARGARIYAEVAGHASSADGFHMAALDPEAAGPIRAMQWALQDSGVDPTEVDYINPHGSSTPANDAMETKAIKRVFGEQAYDIPVSSTKSMIGHPLGASGVLEAIATLMAIYKGIIPPTINYETPDPDCDLDYVPNAARRAEVNVAMSNSFGLGGQNAWMVLKKFSANGNKKKKNL